MNTKIAIVLIFGLVFQLSLLIPGMAAVMSHTPAAPSCECCAELDSCPCAKEGAPVQNPLPLAPGSSQTLKVPLAEATGTRVSVEAVSRLQASASIVASTTTGRLPGFTGVRLSVAFCSFVM